MQWADVDEEYSFSFVFKGEIGALSSYHLTSDKQLLLRLQR